MDSQPLSCMNAIADDEVSTGDSNIRLNERTIEIGKMYDSLLSGMLDNLRFSQGKIDKKSKIARNTYKTIVNGSTLIKILNNGTNDYTLLMNFEMPELKNLYDGELMGAFT